MKEGKRRESKGPDPPSAEAPSSCDRRKHTHHIVLERLPSDRDERVNERWRARRTQEQAAARSLRPPQGLGSVASTLRRSRRVICRSPRSESRSAERRASGRAGNASVVRNEQS